MTAARGGRGRAPEHPWGARDVVAGLVVGFVASAVIGGVVFAAADYDVTPWASAGAAACWAAGSVAGAAPTIHPPHLISMAVQAVLNVPLWVGLVGAPALAARRAGGTLRDQFGFAFRRIDPLIGLPIGVVAQLVVVPVLYWPLRPVVDQIEVEQPARELVDRATGLGVVVLVLVVVVGAPLIEELFYRGLLQRSALRRFPPAGAIALTSVVFALSHLQLVQFPALVVFGAIAGVLAWRTGRLGPSVFAHVGFNLATVVTLLLAR